jgi:hypothetical protein
MDFMTVDEMYAYCESQQEADGFCRLNNGCSGPSPSNNGYELEEARKARKETGADVIAYSGGSCFFLVDEGK